MKTICTLLFWVILSVNGINAQKPLTVNEDSIPFGSNVYPGIVVTIPEVDYESTRKSWIKLLQSGTKSDVVNENGELSIFGSNIKDISLTPVNVYSKLKNQDTAVQVMAIIELKKDDYLGRSSGDAVLASAKNFMKNFGKDQYLDEAGSQLKAEEKKLKDMENELASLRNDKTRMQRSIQSNRTLIIEENDNITLRNNELASLTNEILSENNQLIAMEEGPAREEKDKFIKDLEKQKNKTLNAVKSSENKINKANDEINKANDDIPRNESKQEEIRQQIAKQEAVVKYYSDKLHAIEEY